MKKRLLFVMESLGIGGAEKSLVTILAQLDYSKYEVDLFLFQQMGEFSKLVPKEVNIIQVPIRFKMFMENPVDSLNILIKHKDIRLIILKFIELINLSFYRFILKKEYIGWRFIRKAIESLPKEYDIAIGFMEKKSIYFVVDKVKAKKKIGWIHTDYEKVEHSHKLDNMYFENLDNIVVVSEHGKEVLCKAFPKIKLKLSVIKNMVSPRLIKEMSNESIENLDINSGTNVICTVGRLIEAKGIDIAIECGAKLNQDNINFKWIVIGEGSERNRLQNMINERHLEDKFILLGSRANPYPYINMADVYVQPSRYEGFGITVTEAKILNKPIIVSNIPEFLEQIEDNKTGMIYKNINELENKIEDLLSNEDIRQELSHNLKSTVSIKNGEFDKIERLFS
ncbi:MAG: glycosyltransferase [Clostridium sp.]|nr:glycosyltransferase [Clostridium sp.]MDU7084662.1 glycosyltransferase [Clostridium sp.]